MGGVSHGVRKVTPVEASSAALNSETSWSMSWPSWALQNRSIMPGSSRPSATEISAPSVRQRRRWEMWLRLVDIDEVPGVLAVGGVSLEKGAVAARRSDAREGVGQDPLAAAVAGVWIEMVGGHEAEATAPTGVAATSPVDDWSRVARHALMVAPARSIQPRS